MSEPFIGEIKMFGGNFAPRSYAFCDGQLLPINQNQALFSLLGTTYGGDGRTTFALPDLRGRMPMHFGQGGGLSNRQLGQKGGAVAHTLTVNEMPAHDHPLNASAGAATTDTPSNAVALATTASKPAYRAPSNLTPTAAPLGNSGGSQSHENRQPYVGIYFIIALQGLFPSRN